MQFCGREQISPFSPTVIQVLSFMYSLFCVGKSDGSGLSYSALNTARSALSTMITLDGFPAGQHPLIKRFMRASFNVRPALPRNNVTWDVDIVLAFLKTLGPVEALSLLALSQKLNMLLMLLAGQRGQSVHLLDIVNMTLTHDCVSFRVAELTKSSRPQFHPQELSFKRFDAEPNLCIVRTLQQYLQLTNPLRGDERQLFITTTPPHRGVSRDTIRRWTKSIMAAAGIDLTIFSAHSTRSAATTKAATKVPLATILATAGWSRASTFQQFYEKPLANVGAFSDAILASQANC